jgi:hypothetical protein
VTVTTQQVAVDATQQPRCPTQQSARGQVHRPGTKNYSNEELTSFLNCIKSVLLLGREMWQLVANLHATNFPHCCRNATSIQRKYLKLANEQPGSGNPTISRVTFLAKEIKEATNVKAGVSNLDLSDFFSDDLAADDDDDLDDITGPDGGVDNNPVPTSVEVASASASVNRRASDPSVLSSACNISSGGNIKKVILKKTCTNLLVSAMEDSTSGTASAMSTIISSDNFLKKLS